MFFTKKKAVVALVLGGAGATAAVMYAFRGGTEIIVDVEEHKDVGINKRAQKLVDDFGKVEGGEVF